ncbi:TPA: hypothetical protein ACQUH6_000920 [Neisseria polysaccharea]|uniref:hypothetical protein n=1 Tax=Neisseria polysaccharea TaxID=489 RepID=UPI0027E1C556|nr:hypothetical protein [Neisseria polysaccharea]
MNSLSIIISIILFPGLIATIMCDKLIVHQNKWDIFKYAIYSFLFGVLSYFSLQMVKFIHNEFIVYILKPLPKFDSNKLDVWNIIQNEKSPLNLTEIALATGIAPLLAIFITYIVNKKLLHKYAQSMGLSLKYGDENLYSYYLSQKNIENIYIRDKSSGMIYVGLLSAYSESDMFQELALEDVYVYTFEESELLYVADSIYLSRPQGTLSIEINPRIHEEKNEKEN